MLAASLLVGRRFRRSVCFGRQALCFQAQHCRTALMRLPERGCLGSIPHVRFSLEASQQSSATNTDTDGGDLAATSILQYYRNPKHSSRAVA